MGRTLFVGDVHGCATELRSLLRDTRPTRIILLGDLFTRGPDPRGVWKLIERWGAEAVLGNHDQDVVLGRWHRRDLLPKAALRWLAAQPWKQRGDGWVAVHAGVHPEGLERTRRKHALYLGRHRDRWWWKGYRGDELVLHGHHARDSVLDRRPFTLGLDTRCVRGGALSGYLLEDDVLVGVDAERRYA